MIENKHIVCLGGGVGTANLLRGLKEYTPYITAVVSMADDGGSAGRLRRFYKVPPPGDIINCMIALSKADDTMLKMLQFRFPGNRYGADNILPGQKLGNLMTVALSQIKGDFFHGLLELQRIFQVEGKIYPSTNVRLSLSAKTSTGHIVKREENIDLGRFKGKIEKLSIHPKNPPVMKEVIDVILSADCIIAGPGDLYTTILPVLLIPEILESIKKSKARKLFVVNVANKHFETPNYTISDYADAIKNHCKSVLFDTFLVNNKKSVEIPHKFNKEYQHFFKEVEIANGDFEILYEDLINEEFSLYHDSRKLAKVIAKTI
jgi:uncharacterized cofD-like protein